MCYCLLGVRGGLDCCLCRRCRLGNRTQYYSLFLVEYG
jgi:hypothetical protein